MINEVLGSCIIIEMYFILYFTYVHAFIGTLINAHQVLTNYKYGHYTYLPYAN